MRRLLISLAALALAACSTAPAPASPALWRLSDPDTTIYLFGTVHVLPEKLEWRSPGFDRAFDAADELVLEIADQGDRAAMARTFAQLALSPDLPPVVERVSPEKRAAFAALVERAGLKPAQLDRLETWAAAVTLGASLYASVGLTPDNGVERSLAAGAEASGKPVTGLETTAQQLGYFDALSEAAQRQLLESVIDEAGSVDRQFAEMLAAWSRGDVEAIARTFDDELRLSPDLAEALLDRRNQAWVEWLRQRLDRPGTAFVAVGAGHLAGKGSVIERLEAAGLEVARVQ